MAEDQSPRKIISVNNNARGDYHIVEKVEAGIVLTGTEVKSIRQTAPGLKECYVEIRPRKGVKKGSGFEAFLVNLHLAPYSHGNIWNHDARQPRKLLLNRRQLDRLHGALAKEGLSVVPTQMYFLKGRVKVEIALGRGKKKADKRQDVKSRESKREMDRAMKSSKRSNI